MMKRDVSLFVMLLHPLSLSPPSLELRDGGVLSVNTPLPRSKRETEGVFLLSTCHHATTNPSLAQNARQRGSLSTHPSLTRNARRRGCFFCRHATTPPPTPPSLELRDGGVLCQHTLSTLPRSKCEMEGVFLLSTHHHQPLPRYPASPCNNQAPPFSTCLT